MLRSKQTNRQTKTNLFWSLVAVDVESKFHQQWPPFWILVPVLLVSGACPRALTSAPLNSFFSLSNKTPLLLSNKQSLKKNNLLLEDLFLLTKDLISVNLKRVVLASRNIVWKSTLVSSSAVVFLTSRSLSQKSSNELRTSPLNSDLSAAILAPSKIFKQSE